MCVEPFVK